MMYNNFSVYIMKGYEHEDIFIPEGVYDVVSDNSTYSTVPTVATIIYCGNKYKVPLVHNLGYNLPQKGDCIAVYDDFKIAYLDEITNVADIIGLLPTDYDLDEYLSEFDSEENAIKSAILNDWTFKFMTKENLDKLFFLNF